MSGLLKMAKANISSASSVATASLATLIRLLEVVQKVVGMNGFPDTQLPALFMSEQPSNLETEVISAITRIISTIPPGMGDGVWTAAIKRCLIDLGKQKNYHVCTSGFPTDCDGEWLFDLTWYRNDPPNHLREIGLILESEWHVGLDKIKYDFEKLLIAKCPIKVMVFQDYKNNLQDIFSLLETGIHSFRAEPTGEKYILAGYQNSTGKFVFKTVST
jgi:hypothetical protein